MAEEAKSDARITNQEEGAEEETEEGVKQREFEALKARMTKAS
jgi:hypothetical protein